MIDEISKYENPESPYDLIRYVINSLKFRVDFQFDKTNVKSDLITNQPLLVVTNTFYFWIDGSLTTEKKTVI